MAWLRCKHPAAPIPLLECWYVANSTSVGAIPLLLFSSNEGTEPAHIPVQREKMLARFWLRPAGIARSTGFSPRELRSIQSIVIANHRNLMEAWDDFFAD